ncbi:MAG TPA: hypothetical protein VHZ95_12105 [Polyangiales bacterium]|nr:hypothetical protein [Polyangiales bacterium]
MNENTVSRDGPALFLNALRDKPLQRSFGLVVEYAMFASGMSLALALFAARVPLRAIDHRFELQLRERLIDAIAWLSPG